MENKPVDAESLRKLKHDIKNQLSNIHLAIDALQHEVPYPTDDYTFCITTISDSSLKIDELLNTFE